MKKHNRVQSYSRKTIIIALSLFVLLTMGVGYSVLGNSLYMSGSIDVDRYDETLYGVLRKNAKKNYLVQEYTGEHKDSYAGTGMEKIYHWYASTNDEATIIMNKNNVIFADYCWQILRTTDTGGVKIIYNGEAVNGQCLNTRGRHVGYKDDSTIYRGGTFYYGTDYTYNASTGQFSLSGTVSSISDVPENYSSIIGQYSCFSTSSSDTCSEIYYIFDIVSDLSSYFKVFVIDNNQYYYEIGRLPFNYYQNSPADIGYMYNKRYKYGQKEMVSSMHENSTQSINSYNYWISDDVIYDSTNNTWSLVNPVQYTNEMDYNELADKYTFFSTDSTENSSTIYYITGVSSSKLNYVSLKNGQTLSQINDVIVFGDSYVDNEDGTYTIPNSSSISRFDWYLHYNDVNKKYLCENPVDDKCDSIKYVESVNELFYRYLMVTSPIKYANSFSYDNGVYTLTGESYTFWDLYDESNITLLKNAHYTCFNETGVCTRPVYLTFRTKSTGSSYSFTFSYVSIEDGKTITEELNEMLYASDVNQYDSTVKMGIDKWYEKHLLNYTNYLEDAVFCNNRYISNYSFFNPNGGSLGQLTYYGGYFQCQNETDQFSLTNPKATLTYPIALPTKSELLLSNHSAIRSTGTRYWAMSGGVLSYYIAEMGSITGSGGYTTYPGVDSYDVGVRPVISLKPGIKYTSGDGSMENPYIVDTN